MSNGFLLLELFRSLFLGAVLNVMELGQTKFPGRFPMSKMAIRTWGPGACRDVGVLDKGYYIRMDMTPHNIGFSLS